MTTGTFHYNVNIAPVKKDVIPSFRAIGIDIYVGCYVHINLPIYK
jgi:hypothetical protein